MSILELASTAFSQLKDTTTKIILNRKNRLISSEFFNKNKIIIILLCLIIWISIPAYYYSSVYLNLIDKYFQKASVDVTPDGLSAIEILAEKGTHGLIRLNDKEKLNKLIDKVRNTKNLHFAAIVDANNIILAHTNPASINQPIIIPSDYRNIASIHNTSIKGYISSDNQTIILFSKDSIWEGKIRGQFHVAIMSQSENPIRKNKMIFIGIIIIIPLVLYGFLEIFSFIYTYKLNIKKSNIQTEKESNEYEIQDVPTVKEENENRARFEKLPEQVGPYILQERLGIGGMAEVFRAVFVRKNGFKRICAVKRILSHLAQSEEFLNMLKLEAKKTALLNNSSIVRTIDFLEDYNIIEMEYINGKNIAQIMGKINKGLPIDQVVYIISHICMGLYYAHEVKDKKTNEPLRIVHRDISPQNILISFEGDVKIADFGIAKIRSEPSLTKAGFIKGKYEYISPEQALGKPADHQSDIYALGVVFYEMLSGKRLNSFITDIEALNLIPKQKIDNIKKTRQDIPDEMDRIVMKCLEKDKKRRYQNAWELLDDLRILRRKLSITYDKPDLSTFMKKCFK